MLLNVMFRGGRGGAPPPRGPRGRAGRGGGPTLMLIGPVTSFRIRFEKDMFSKRDPGLPWSLKGQPNTWCSTQFDTVMFSAVPPPKRKTHHRVLNVQLVTVMTLQLPNKAQASSCVCTVQLLIVTCSQLMKWNPSSLPLTRLKMCSPSIWTYFDWITRTL